MFFSRSFTFRLALLPRTAFVIRPINPPLRSSSPLFASAESIALIEGRRPLLKKVGLVACVMVPMLLMGLWPV